MSGSNPSAGGSGSSSSASSSSSAAAAAGGAPSAPAAGPPAAPTGDARATAASAAPAAAAEELLEARDELVAAKTKLDKAETKLAKAEAELELYKDPEDKWGPLLEQGDVAWDSCGDEDKPALTFVAAKKLRGKFDGLPRADQEVLLGAATQTANTARTDKSTVQAEVTRCAALVTHLETELKPRQPEARGAGTGAGGPGADPLGLIEPMSRGIQQLLDRMNSTPPKPVSELTLGAMKPLRGSMYSKPMKMFGGKHKSATKEERDRLSLTLRELSNRCINLVEIAGIGTNVDSVQVAVREFFTDAFPPPQGSACAYEVSVQTPSRAFPEGDTPAITGFIDRVWVMDVDAGNIIPRGGTPVAVPILGVCEDKRGLEANDGKAAWSKAEPQLKGQLLAALYGNSVNTQPSKFPVPGMLTNGTLWIFAELLDPLGGEPPSLRITPHLDIRIDSHVDNIVNGLIWFRGQVADNMRIFRALEAAAASEGGSGGDDSLLAGGRDGTDEQGGPPSQGASGNSNGENRGGAPGHHPNVPSGTRNHLTVTTKIMNRIAQRGLVNPIDYYWPPRPILRG
eukprot:TRINITY_DN718_c0_g1_i10.p1 TRINITY_DN718_c0_g1~~TRINITY_DN718_c0_g1_i10.p1  ORF type:complete len:601 (-),score=73.96 TRINITY_DN718_c0_g1_i10:97-1803(-)